MKKYSIKVFLCIVCMFVVGFMFTGCDLQDFSFGKSAYEIAVDNGFEGTEQEWLESLKGESGEYAGQGKSAYEIAVDNGFEGTEAEWLASLNTFEDDFKVNMNKCLTSIVSIMAVEGDNRSTGSGVIVYYNSVQGFAYVITNYHVVCDSKTHDIASSITCYSYGREYGGTGFNLATECVGYSPDDDIAVLKVYISNELFAKSKITVATLGNSSKLEVGQSVGAIGNSKGYGISLTRGVVSLDSEYTSFEKPDDTGTSTVRVIRYDAYIINGNSGGGLFNVKGELIGIVNATSTKANFYYAIPINLAYGIYTNIINNLPTTSKKASKVGLGITLRISDSVAKVDEETGSVYIKEDVEIAYIDKMKMRLLFNENDQILSVEHNGIVYEINRIHEVSELMWRVNVGDTLKFKVKRSGIVKEISFVAEHLYDGVNNGHTDKYAWTF